MDSEMAEQSKEEKEGTVVSLCRVCACYSELLMPIFEGEGLENSLPDKLKRHLPVQVKRSDHLPLKICYQCASTIISWHDLVVNCIDADRKLRSMFEAADDQQKDFPIEDLHDVSTAEVSFPSDMFEQESDDNIVISSVSTLVDKKSRDDSPLDSNSKDVASVSTEAASSSPERFIDLTEDCDEVLSGEAKESNTNSYHFGPQNDHSYTLPPTNSPTPSNAVKPDPPRSHQYRAILPRPPRTNISTLFSPQTSVSTKSSVMTVKTKISGSSSKTPLFLFCTKSQGGAQSPAKKAVLVPLKAVQEAVAGKKTPSTWQKVKVSRSPQTSVQRPIAPKTTLLLNSSVSITPVQNSSVVKPLDTKSVNIKPSVTIMPVPKKTSIKQNRVVMKSLLTGEKSARYKCSICSAEFLHEAVRRMHMFRSHGVKPYTCNVCSEKFGMISKLRAHLREKHASANRKDPNSQLKYACTMCDSSFLWHRDLISHKREKHAPPIRSVSQEPKKEKTVVAGIEVSEKEKEMLNKFYVKIDGRDWYHCKECMKSWKSRDKAVLHIRTHTKERMYSCEICDQKFNTPGVLKRHLQVHQGKKPFQCEYCEKSFSSKQNRDDHHRFHTKEVKTVCESCGEFLTSASMLYYHRKIHSGVNPYVCPYCKKAYAIRALLKRHIRFHTGEKPHLCSVCGRGFFTSGQLRGHSLVHTDVRPFSCDKCGARMKSTKYLNRHKAICQTSRKK